MWRTGRAPDYVPTYADLWWEAREPDVGERMEAAAEGMLMVAELLVRSFGGT